DGASDIISHKARYAAIQNVIDDLDKALSLNPRLVFALFNKGNIYYDLGDYQSAMKCYSDALAIYPEFGEAYFNRGLSYLRSGNKNQAFADLSKAGELGVLPSYNILKRMK
ncbi:MAG: tetratricopeptide repeat protein, partial [Muribaculaceae bacterium]|nr:tetratricopeptide repeat protein [Muribaculaceae bacterium]